jgi:hypothetical protein
MAVILLALLLYVVVIQRPAQEASVNATSTAGVIAPTAATTSGSIWPGVTSDQILSIQVEDRAAGRRLTLARPDPAGQWTLADPAEQPAEQTAANSAATSAALWTYSNQVAAPQDLSPFGVLSPTYVVELRLADGSLKKISIGDKTVTGTMYYVLRESDTDVLVVAQSTIEQLTRLLDSPPYPPTATPAFSLPTAVPTETPAP